MLRCCGCTLANWLRPLHLKYVAQNPFQKQFKLSIVSPSATDLACVRLLNRRKRLEKMQRKRAGNSLTTTSAVCHFPLFHLSTMIHYTLPAGLVFQIDFF